MDICLPPSSFIFFVLALVIGVLLAAFYSKKATQVICKAEPIVVHSKVQLPAMPQQQPSLTPTRVALVPDTATEPVVPNIPRNDYSYIQMGYVSSGSTRLPLFGHKKYPYRDRYEYYVIDNNGIKIPFSQTQNKELYDKDTVTIPGFTDTFTANIYKQEDFAYGRFPINI